MKQFTTPEQTAKLIELGLPKPKSEVKAEQAGDYAWYNPAYSIGELISFLPQFLDFDDGEWSLSIEADPFKTNRTWWVFYAPSSHTESGELIDALYAMIVKLKEEGVI